jgi:hypothetical protein
VPIGKNINCNDISTIPAIKLFKGDKKGVKKFNIGYLWRVNG